MTDKSYPLNAWYAVSWDYEIAKGRMLPRTICEKPLIFYRKLSGQAVAMDDACWHRLAPLSKGTLRGDIVVCPYHGLEFEPGGRCVHMPSQETINPSACVRTYPLVEAHRLAWIWMGDPAKADLALVPDLHWNDDPEWAGDGGTLHLKCNYLLAVDNLMDLTHETFVHAGSIGNEAVAEAPFDVNHSDGYVRVTRWMMDAEPPGFWGAQLADHTAHKGNVDRWQIIHFHAPSTITLDVGVTAAGKDRTEGVGARINFAITPETEGTTHYFWTGMRDFDLQSQSRTNVWRTGVVMIFAQDEAILDAQQRAIEANPDKVFYDLNIDAGGAWARRKITQMIEAEAPSFKRVV